MVKCSSGQQEGMERVARHDLTPHRMQGLGQLAALQRLRRLALRDLRGVRASMLGVQDMQVRAQGGMQERTTAVCVRVLALMASHQSCVEA